MNTKQPEEIYHTRNRMSTKKLKNFFKDLSRNAVINTIFNERNILYHLQGRSQIEFSYIIISCLS